MDVASSQLVPGDLRVSDADRDRALAELSEHYQSGRLTLEEFDERSGQALQARTARELTGLFTDLPAAQAGTMATQGTVAIPGFRPPVAAVRVIVAVATIAAVALVVSVLARTGLVQHTRHPFATPWPLFVLLLIVVRLVAPRRLRRRGSRRDAPVQDR
jgi:hypothetical protein